ncbi:uncharacterized protein LOC128649698 [Bombina bombina]|uniref:uncharacterized protein LOC128649698 n=1 Tax=Bombina bombina TaxID=8345 RepID=UPI00235A9F7D|nr:uncharacterized protein LOC128649698 [Bombina bombina]
MRGHTTTMSLDVESRLSLLMSLLMKRRRTVRLQHGNELRKLEAWRRRRNRMRMYQQQSQQTLTLLLMRERAISYSLENPNHCSFLVNFRPCDWLDRFRLSKDTFLYLCDQLRSHLQCPGLAPEEKLGIALWKLSSKPSCPLLQSTFRVGHKVVYKCVKEVCQAIVTVLKPTYLHPPNAQALKDMARIFNARWGFPHCVGALGSVRIPLPARGNADGSHFLVLQVAVDGQGLLWDAGANFSSGLGTASILENSLLWAMARDGGLQASLENIFLDVAHNYFLLGDATYPLQDWLLTPYPQKGGQSERQARFNLQLERARSVADIALLRLRARWQCLLAPSGCPLVPTLGLACCVLHNVCETHEQSFDSRWLEGLETTDSPQALSPSCSSITTDVRAEFLRDSLCTYFERQTVG